MGRGNQKAPTRRLSRWGTEVKLVVTALTRIMQLSVLNFRASQGVPLRPLLVCARHRQSPECKVDWTFSPAHISTFQSTWEHAVDDLDPKHE